MSKKCPTCNQVLEYMLQHRKPLDCIMSLQASIFRAMRMSTFYETKTKKLEHQLAACQKELAERSQRVVELTESCKDVLNQRLDRDRKIESLEKELSEAKAKIDLLKDCAEYIIAHITNTVNAGYVLVNVTPNMLREKAETALKDCNP